MLRVQARTLARPLVGVASFGKEMVIQTPAFPERLDHLPLLGGGREKTVSKRFKHFANYTVKATL
jgi:hypothetical protein